MTPDSPTRTETSPAPRDCPVCGGSSKSLLFRQQFSDLSSGSLLRGYDLVVCDACGFAYADGIPPQSVFDDYYAAMSKYEYAHRGGREPDWVLDRYRDTAAFLEPYLPSKDAGIADVGCATGGLLAVLRDRGYPHVTGFDPSPACSRAARDLYGIRVLTRTLFNFADAGEKFDALFLLGVLEHVRDLNRALEQVRASLNDGGVLCVDVPDATEFANVANAPFQELSTEHINFFARGSLSNLLAAHGFTLLTWRKKRQELSRDAIEPSVMAAFRKAPAGTDAPRVERDTETAPALAEYVRKSRAEDEQVRRAIGEVARRGEPIVVWGTGSHTLRLLATGGLAGAKVAAFVDSNTNYVGKQLNGVPIIAPDQLSGRPEPILVSSYVYQREIERQIREKLGLSNPLILLYRIRSIDRPEAGKKVP